MTQKPLRILFAEESDADALPVLDELRCQGYDPQCTRVATAVDFRGALETTGKFDVILCACGMPCFDVREALEILRESRVSLPLIVVSEVPGEECAVEMMRLGAVDYLLKRNLAGLGAALARDLTAWKETVEIRTANETRYIKQRNALISLTRNEPNHRGDIVESFRRITEASAETLGVSRVSLWRYNPGRTEIVCMDLYDLEAKIHCAGTTLHASDYPSYFQGMAEMELIVADDAHTNPHTFEFSDSYLRPLGIGSMLDAPIRFGGAVEYVLCHEHVGPFRRWTADEKTFAVAVANLVSLVLESHERARAEAEVLKSHERFQSVAAATNDTIWDWDLLTDSFWWSDGFANLFGWSATKNEPTVRAWIRQIHPEDRSRVVGGIYAAIEGGQSHWVDEYRFMSNDGAIAGSVRT